jgi:RNA polymerase sigma-70 factor (ECF subfamily)
MSVQSIESEQRESDAFQMLVGPHRDELYAYCRRMLGSRHDAEDAFQDAMLRAWRALPALRDAQRLRPWLYAIANNTSLDLIKRRSTHVPTSGDDTDSTSDELLQRAETSLGDRARRTTPESHHERREAITDAFTVALTRLPHRQRTVLVLREVLRFSAREVADLLDTTVPAVNSILQRARSTVNASLPRREEHRTFASLAVAHARILAEHCTDAFEAGDIETVVTVLSTDPTSPRRVVIRRRRTRAVHPTC